VRLPERGIRCRTPGWSAWMMLGFSLESSTHSVRSPCPCLLDQGDTGLLVLHLMVDVGPVSGLEVPALESRCIAGRVGGLHAVEVARAGLQP